MNHFYKKVFGENQSFSSKGLDTKNRNGKIKVWDNAIQIKESIRIIQTKNIIEIFKILLKYLKNINIDYD